MYHHRAVLHTLSCSLTPLLICLALCDPLKNGNSPRRTSNPTPNMQRRAGQEKAIPPFLLTLLTQLLQIPHFANRRAPMHKQPLMQTPAIGILRGPSLKSEVVGNNGGKVAVIKPADGALRGLQADGKVVILGARFALRFCCITVFSLSATSQSFDHPFISAFFSFQDSRVKKK